MRDRVGKIKKAKNTLHSLGKNKCLMRWEKITSALGSVGWVGANNSALAFLLIIRKIIYHLQLLINRTASDIKKELLFFLAALSFGFKWSVKWKLVKATGTAQRNKANDCSETF